VIAFIGDVHRAFDRLTTIVDGLPAEVGAVVQVGDLGLLPSEVAERCALRLARPMYFISGNHDYEPWFHELAVPTEIAPNLIYVPRGAVLPLDARRVAFLGGGDSVVDRARRHEGVDWWPEEQVTGEHVARLGGAGPVDIMVAHTPPAAVYPFFGYRPDPSAREVERAWELLGRPPIVCGHLHRSRAVGPVRVLAELELLLL
jgi:calcineurin-like phosphoesterase family protein